MKDYTEEKLVELPAIELFQSLDYKHLDCFNGLFAKIINRKILIGNLYRVHNLLLPGLISYKINFEKLDITTGGQSK